MVASQVPKYRSIQQGDYELLFKLDQAVYPTASPVTGQILAQWYKHNPEFGIIFPGSDPTTTRGLFVTIPLSELGWRKLVSGELTEKDMIGDMIFDPHKDKKIALHNYHIEKFTEEKGFYMIALGALAQVTSSVAPTAELLGLSAYAVTESGLALHENIFNMHEGSYISKEYVVNEGGVLRVANLNNQEEVEKLTARGATAQRCKMLVTIPGEKSVVWDFLKNH